jgi:hypothetical protein
MGNEAESIKNSIQNGPHSARNRVNDDLGVCLLISFEVCSDLNEVNKAVIPIKS